MIAFVPSFAFALEIRLDLTLPFSLRGHSWSRVLTLRSCCAAHHLCRTRTRSAPRCPSAPSLIPRVILHVNSSTTFSHDALLPGSKIRTRTDAT